MISNPGRADRPVTHCWNTLDLYPKMEIFLFDLYGVNSLQKFLIQEDKKIIDKILFEIHKSEANVR